MRYLRKFNESKAVSDDYKELSQILQSEVFDNYDIYYVDNYDPNQITWLFDSSGTSLEDDDTDCICIYNVPPDIHDKLMEDIESIKKAILSMTGIEYICESLELMQRGVIIGDRQIEIRII